MEIISEFLSLSTRGFNDIINLTGPIQDKLAALGLKEGQVTVFVPGSTGGVTTIEFEPGLVKDLSEALDRVAPEGQVYHHDARWGDGNGFSHVRAALIGPSLTVPFQDGRLLLGTWQQIVLIDFDNRPRRRQLVIQFMGQ
ncbi:MAG: secondary thiamine-phosphate synthase enzyme [Candidatus Aminicenantes bacterium 4484_214]|nr:MAG: secondary thiamine-phosphate synthase enzyme [Candidatus Aminicenantes bacterium 4484_214]